MRLSRSTQTGRTMERGNGACAPVPAVRSVARDLGSAVDPLAHERRLRASGGPEDNATYHCGCGFVFSAAVSTGVTCPQCGAGQAW